MTKVVPRRPQDKLDGSSGHFKRSKATLSDLPEGTRRDWQNIFTPVWKDYLGTLEKPWDASGPGILSAIQDTWDTVFPEVARTFESTGDPVTQMVWHLFSISV